jgi:hypothetical protein
MTQLLCDITVSSDIGTLKYYLDDEGKCLSSWTDPQAKLCYFNDLAVDNIDDALAGIQGMYASHLLRESDKVSPIERFVNYQLFGHYVEEGNRL